jgi:hypothetical protein
METIISQSLVYLQKHFPMGKQWLNMTIKCDKAQTENALVKRCARIIIKEAR